MGLVLETTATPIALVDDDDLYRDTLVVELGGRGFRVHGFADGETCLAALEQGLSTDLVLLDWELPRLQGLDVLRLLLARNGKRRVIVLSGGSPVQRELDALRGGAVDFVDKARGVDVLVPRMRLVMSTDVSPPPPAPEPAAVAWGPLLLPDRGRAQWRGRAIGLTVAEARIAGLLAANAGRPLTYRAIYDQVHQAGFSAGRGARGYELNVRTMIKRMRRKFEAIDPDFEAIRSVARLGYWWDASP
ncbi:MAG: response regulator transcription factor [Reyranella sp.]|nr:response regulator transcription factor [Reyranella sp.]